MRHPTTLVALAQYRQQEIARQVAQLRLPPQAPATPSSPDDRPLRGGLQVVHTLYANACRRAWSFLHG